jgi:hypothetical protein
MPTLYAVTVDTEEEWDWKAGWPVTNLSVENIRYLPRFQELCARHGAAVTYFADQAVLDAPEARAVLLDLAPRDRVEIGMHLHPWNTPPLDGAPVTARQTFLHNLPEDQIVAKLDSVYSCFTKHGLKPTSFRGGRYSSGGVIHRFLRDRGFLVDASVVPFTTWDDDGAPDYRDRNLLPRRLPPRSAGELPLWEVPLTLAFTRRPFAFWRSCYEVVERTWLRRLRLIGIAERFGVVRKVWLNFEDPLGDRMLALLPMLRGLSLPCVCFTVHSSSLAAGLGPYTRTEADEDRLFAQVDEALKTLSGWPDFRPATVTEVACQLESAHEALHDALCESNHG